MNEEKLDIIEKRLKRIELRQTIQLAVIVLGAFGIIAYIKNGIKKI
jgi:hypothetical protein